MVVIEQRCFGARSGAVLWRGELGAGRFRFEEWSVGGKLGWCACSLEVLEVRSRYGLLLGGGLVLTTTTTTTDSGDSMMSKEERTEGFALRCCVGT